MKKLAIALGLILLVFHHDFWNWDDSTLVLGFMPVGMAYHVGFSIAAAGFWAFVIKFAWPDNIESWADADASESAPETTQPEVETPRYKIT